MAQARHKAQQQWGAPPLKPRKQAPTRSSAATQAHAAGDVTWTIDLAMPAEYRISHRTAKRNAKASTALIAFAAALYVADALYLVTHWR